MALRSDRSDHPGSASLGGGSDVRGQVRRGRARARFAFRIRGSRPAGLRAAREGTPVNGDVALSMVAELLRLGLLLCLPLLGIVLLVGLLVSVLQVVTQLQDPSIAFVPKLAAFAVALVLLAPWMLERLTAYAIAVFARIPHLA
jgi:flagellar biosynthetic protein FliQ